MCFLRKGNKIRDGKGVFYLKVRTFPNSEIKMISEE